MVHIVTYCPSCHTRYQLEPSLRGLRVECPNPVCRCRFEVRDDPDEPDNSRNGPQPSTSSNSGVVGEMIPILEAEIVNETAEPKSKAAPRSEETPGIPMLPAQLIGKNEPESRDEIPSWYQPPPVRNPRAAREAPSRLEPDSSEGGAATAETDAGDASPEAPAIAYDASKLEPTAPSAAEFGEPAPFQRKRKRALMIILTLISIGGVALGVATKQIYSFIKQGETLRAAQATKDYKQGRFQIAADEHQKLWEDYPDSRNRPRYAFFKDFSRIRESASNGDQAGQTYADLKKFLSDHRSDPILKDEDVRNDVTQTYVKLGDWMVAEAQERLDNETLKRASQALEDAISWGGKGDPVERLAERIKEGGEKIARQQRFNELRSFLARLLTKSPITTEDVRVAKSQARIKGFEQEAEIKGLISQLEDSSIRAIRYKSAPKQMFPRGGPMQRETSFLVVPQLVKSEAPPGDSRRIVLALARGVLHALDQKTGEIRWAMRVGIDTTTLPVALPATEFSDQLFLVLSADRNTLKAVRAQDGTTLWQHPLSGACLGRPTVVNGLAYVPTYNGVIEEIEIAQGFQVGYFDLGQPLSVGGAYQEDTGLFFIPGDSEFIYILDLGAGTRGSQSKREKKLVGVLHTGHPSGALRSEPIIVPRVDPSERGQDEQLSWRGFLILGQADGLEHMRLRVFDLPIENREASPLLQTEPISGWSWFQAYHDFEKIAFATDAGFFGLFGINQFHNEDKPLFPLLQHEERKIAASAGRLGRAQVVHAVERDFWVLDNGELQRYRFQPYLGQRLVRNPDWPAGLRLGSPLHAAQFDDRQKTIFLVTQDLVRQIDLATAVDVDSGKIRWQRQLGVECAGEAVTSGSDVLVMDRGGALARFQASETSPTIGGEWRIAESFIANPISGAATSTHLLPGPDGAVYHVAYSSQGDKLTVRRYQSGREGQKPSLEETVIEKWPAAIRGSFTIGSKSVILPLADGTTQRLRFPLDGSPGNGGPNWRDVHADDGALGHVVQISDDEFLTTDGSRGITHWKWPEKGTFQAVPPDKPLPTAQTKARIVSPPVALLPEGPSDSVRVFVADYNGNLTLLTGAELKVERVWQLGGQVTAGPFVRGQRVGCIIDRRRLVWVDPERDKPLWEYTSKGEGIVGEPRLVEKMLLVADLSGKFVALDPDTGKQLGKEYTLAASAAPVATPLPFSVDEAMVPLTDGTVLLLPLRDFHK